jgi:hypothetical protein
MDHSGVFGIPNKLATIEVTQSEEEKQILYEEIKQINDSIQHFCRSVLHKTLRRYQREVTSCISYSECLWDIDSYFLLYNTIKSIIDTAHFERLALHHLFEYRRILTNICYDFTKVQRKYRIFGAYYIKCDFAYIKYIVDNRIL